MRTVSVTELQPVVGEVVLVEQKENAIRLWFQGITERFGVYVPDSVRKGIGTLSVGDVVSIEVEVGRFGFKALAIARVAADGE